MPSPVPELSHEIILKREGLTEIAPGRQHVLPRPAPLAAAVAFYSTHNQSAVNGVEALFNEVLLPSPICSVRAAARRFAPQNQKRKLPGGLIAKTATRATGQANGTGRKF